MSFHDGCVPSATRCVVVVLTHAATDRIHSGIPGALLWLTAVLGTTPALVVAAGLVSVLRWLEIKELVSKI